MRSYIDILILIFPNIILLCAGYLIHIKLANHFTPEIYGTYSVVMGIFITMEYFIIHFIPRGIVNLIARFPGRIEDIKRSLARYQFTLGLCLFAVCFITADVIAGSLKDRSLSFYIRTMSFYLPASAAFNFFLAFYYAFKQFKKAGFFLILLAVFRLTWVFSAAGLGMSLNWIFSGYVLIPLMLSILLFCRLSGHHRGRIETTRYDLRPYLYMALFQFTVYAILYTGLFMLKRAGLDDLDVGIYALAFNISSVVFYAFIPVQIFVFRMLSQALHSFDKKAAYFYIGVVNKFILFALIPAGLFISIFSREIVGFIFPEDYYYAGYILSILVFGVMFIVLFVIYSEIINIINPRISLIMGAVLLASEASLCRIFIDTDGIFGAVKAIFITSIAGILAAAFIYKILIRRHFIKAVPSGITSPFLLINFVYLSTMERSARGLIIPDLLSAYPVKYENVNNRSPRPRGK